LKDQMLPRGYISDNWHFPDSEFQQIIEGMRRLKPAWDELTTTSAPNNMASMQEIDEAVLQLVKDSGKKLANTIRTNNHVPPPGPGIAPAQVIGRPMLLPLNAPPQCQWSIATGVVPNAGPVGQNAPLANAPGPAQNVPAPPAGAQALPAPLAGAQTLPAPLAGAQAVRAPPAGAQAVRAPPAGAQAVRAPPAGAQAVRAPPAGAQAVRAPPAGAQAYLLPWRVPKPYLLPRRIPKLRTLPHHQARPIPKLRKILHPLARRIPKISTLLRPQARLIPNVGLVSVWAISTGRKMRTNPRIFLRRSNRVPQWTFWVCHWVSNMLQRIPQVQSICQAQKIYLCKSKRIHQWLFSRGQWGCDMLLWRLSRKPRHRTWRILGFNTLM